MKHLVIFFNENENKAQKELDTFSQRGFRNVRVKRVLVKGDPAQEIVCYAHSERSISVQTVPGLPDGRLNWRPGYIPSSLLCTLSQVLTFLAKGTVRQNGYVWRAIKQRRLSQSSCIGAMLTQRFIWRQPGHVTEMLCSAATKRRASLLVIGRGPVTDDGARLSTNAYAIIRKSPCPVLSV